MSKKQHHQHWLSIILPLLLFSVLFAISDHLTRIERKSLKEEQYSQVLLQASAARAQLESELNSTLHITTGLTGYIAINPELKGYNDVRKVLATLFQYGHHLRNIGFAPGNVIHYVYPLKGNEKAIGLNYEKHPLQWPAVERAIISHSTVLAGPINLVQGGRGIISRTPVFLDDGKYWGILSLVIDIDSLFIDAGLLSKDSTVDFSLRGKDGQGKEGALFLGREEVFKQSPIILNLTVPGGVWQMAAVPKSGWGSNLKTLTYYHIGGFIIALVLSVMLWVILNDRWKIQHLALHDALTALPNRRLFNERLNYTLMQKQRQHQPFSLLYIDLDNLKPINDQYGHKVGDMVLYEVAKRMSSSVRHEDTVARIGGDEFMIILPSTGGKTQSTHVAQQILKAIKAPFFHQGKKIELSTSIGLSIYPQNGNSVEELIRAADQAMYQAKYEGKGRIYFNQQEVKETS